ncbi:MAG: RelA/SpoT family protein [Alphaproteobacteria bacterium]|jgi:guanosine-3',5'-bis(diphosphate) 3'-pyrophosphohydrolase
MMRQYELIEKVLSYDADANELLLNKAYVYAMKAHGSQKRDSGDLYFSHPLEVAAILTEFKLDDATIATALLHDTVEDTNATLSEIKDIFGDEISGLVSGLTKIGKLNLISKETEQAENFRRLILAISDDVRVLMIKLADRLHNMRTINYLSDDKKNRIAKETMDIYAPLAGRMGIQSMREELEDLCFEVMNPEARSLILNRLSILSDKSSKILMEIEQELTEKIKNKGISVKIEGREKKPYSIWKKIERKSISLEQLSDVYGFRAVTNNIEDCYNVIGIVHREWRAVPGRFKDYISTPKQNDYRSIHTTLIGPNNQRIELQVRSNEMQEVAERGLASHTLYKDSKSSAVVVKAKDTRAYKWLYNLLEMLEDEDSPQEFFENTKLELFEDQVFCFTPKGRIIALPRGATPIDFAYSVHTDIGDKCKGCRINGIQSPLTTEIVNGDEILIICDDKRHPPSAWERVAVTGKAKSSIRRINKEKIHKQYSKLGSQIIDRILLKYNIDNKNLDMNSVCSKFGMNSIEDLNAKIGRGEIDNNLLLKALNLDKEKITNKLNIIKQNTYKHSLPIRGIDNDLPVKFSDNSRIVPGDRIFGILIPGEGITIHSKYSKKSQIFNDQLENWIDITWDVDAEKKERFSGRIIVDCANEVGALAKISQVIGSNNANIENLILATRSKDFYKLDIDIGVWDLSHLNKIISALRKLSVIHRVTRIID